ncbi:hypothetical protein JX266_011920 [Neoarthrinium moseri]|nr:hypothetical protein JX266_011920 [Neoarthrinium moseri]
MFYENHPVYVEQRLKLEPTFAGKSAQIATQFHQFRQEVAPVSHNKVWEKDIIAENDNVQIISNWASFDVLQYQDKPARAGMSMLHLLAIPREAIINGVYLTDRNVSVIDEMIHLFEETWAKPEKQDEILQHQITAIDRRAKNMEGEPFAKQAHEAARAHYDELVAMVKGGPGLGVGDFQYGLHLRPDNSADYLHLHIIAAPYEYRKYSTSEHDKKTKDAVEVRDFIIQDARTSRGGSSRTPSISDEAGFRSRVDPI